MPDDELSIACPWCRSHLEDCSDHYQMIIKMEAKCPEFTPKEEYHLTAKEGLTEHYRLEMNEDGT